MSAAWALAWEMWARQRWAFRLGALYLAVLIVVARALPAEALDPAGLLSLLTPLFALVAWMLVAFSYGFTAPFEGAASTFPQRLFTLPVPTAVLVGCPMLLAITSAGLLWCACVWGVLWRVRADVPDVFPAVLL